MSNSKSHVVFIGPSGVGKTTVGEQVAQEMNLKFVDLDALIEKKAGMRVHDFFKENGELAFREIESEILFEVLQDETPSLITPGAGIVERSKNIAAMKKFATVVYLNAQVKDIIARIKADTKNIRPLVADDIDTKVKELYDQRKDIFTIAQDIEIGTSNRSEAQVVESVMRQIGRYTGEKSDIGSEIIAGNEILKNIVDCVETYSSVFVITQQGIPSVFKDAVLDSLLSKNVKHRMIFIPEGEEGKSEDSYFRVLNEMAENGGSRQSCVIALGGGVVGDLSGYVASTFMRGIDLIQVPTTLLAQVDSAIGGKNGINLKAGKNLVGTITQAKMVIADSQCLTTLPEADYLSGLGEVVKYALLGNDQVWDLIENHSEEILKRDPIVLAKIIEACMKHKVHVVSRDPFERNGMRATLNLGHTLAHVIEKATDYKIAHGEAVAIGLRYISELSLELDLISKEQHQANIDLIDSLKLGRSIPTQARVLGAEKLVAWMLGDKKSAGDTLNMVLFQSDSTPKLTHDVDQAVASKVLDNFLTNA